MEFYKFDGAGNDFVVVDNRQGSFVPTVEEVALICHRRFGVGADGLMTLERSADYDFEMRYYNSDGRLGSMCGNGGRCIAAFAHLLGLGRELRFEAFDGLHSAVIDRWDGHRGVVSLGMREVPRSGVRAVEGGWALDTGSPHFVLPVDALDRFDVVGEGRRWRQRADLFPEGVNVDFVERRADGAMAVRTYERGVEDETWACGTGVTAVALVTGARAIVARGGDFHVDFATEADRFSHITLCGPVSLNFIGQWTSSAR